jgi:hypothetical protein
MKSIPVTLILSGLLLIILSSLLITSCTHEIADFGTFDTVCFEGQILPILQTTCGKSGCHSAGAVGELGVINSYNTVLSLVRPGDPKGSRLYQVITAVNGETFMPPDQPLSVNQRMLIEVWIGQGAMDTKCPSVMPDTGTGGNSIPPPVDYGDSVCFNQDILPIFLSNCATAGCHNSTSHVEGIVLTDYNSITSKGIVPYNANNSSLFLVVTTGESDDRMPPPPRSQLTTSQIDMFRTWINDGALNSDCSNGSCDTSGVISFSAQVLTIMQDRCVSCHNSAQASAGVMLDTYTHVKATVDNQRNGTPVLVGAIRRLTGFKAMPPGYSLDECTIRIVELWIEQGATNN